MTLFVLYFYKRDRYNTFTNNSSFIYRKINMESLLTSKELRISNRKRVLSYIYENHFASKLAVSIALGMSMPTVTQNLNELEEIGIIYKDGYLESTGGRKAAKYVLQNTFKIAVGVSIQNDQYIISAVDLFGSDIKSNTFSAPYERSDSYFSSLRQNILDFIDQVVSLPEQLLGVTVCVQGLVSSDGSDIFYAEIYDCKDLTIEDILPDFPYPCRLMHDTEAAAISEIWSNPEVSDSVMILLQSHIGGAIILNGDVLMGSKWTSSVVEHIVIHPGGHPCYCGRKGCADTYCSEYTLTRDSGLPLNTFFANLKTDEKLQTIWDKFLKDLSLLMSNIRILFDYDFILTGSLLSHMTDEDIMKLKEHCDKEHPFVSSGINIKTSKFNKVAISVGGGIYYIKSYLQEVCP